MEMDRTRSGQIPSQKHQHVGQFVDSTSDFRRIDVNSLNIVFKDIESLDDFLAVSTAIVDIPNEVYVSNLSSKEIREIAGDYNAIMKLERKSRTFVQLITYLTENESVVRGTESRTDAFIQHLLEKLEFGEYPLMIQPQPVFKFKVHTKEISSKYDYAVIKDSRVMLVDEYKHFRNTGPTSGWGEYQIAGEMLSGAYCNYSFASTNSYKGTIYAVRAIGLRFTFYKAYISREYLNSLGDGLPDDYFEIMRFPSSMSLGEKSFPHLNYGDPTERRIIIDILIMMRIDISS